ncbi:MAG: calcium/proton exchanger [Elusimicrobia bacterium]|nr:calcium/proton exchanger [Elusimicrobiota bacterium]
MAQIFFIGLLAAVPGAIAAHWLHAPDTLVFALCCLGALGLAGFLGEATEVLAHHLGAGPGALVTAAFGNAAELILGFAALRAGKMRLVKASLTGSILVNLVFILGCSMVAGGWKRPKQTFNSKAVLSGMSVLFLAVAALTIPDLWLATPSEHSGRSLVAMTTGLSVVMVILYGLNLLFTLKTHRHLYAEAEEVVEGHMWSLKKALIVLLASTAATVAIAEIMVEAVEGASHHLGFGETFVGLIIISVVGTAAENATAVRMAAKDKINLSFNIVVESSKQIALFTAPVLVFFSLAFAPQPLVFEFSILELAGLGFGLATVILVALDGESNWLEGAMLLAVYAMLGVGFYYVVP